MVREDLCKEQHLKRRCQRHGLKGAHPHSEKSGKATYCLIREKTGQVDNKSRVTTPGASSAKPN
jgi:hypothetical protein